MRIVGFDSRPLSWHKGKFYGLLATGITVSEQDTFSKLYNSIFDDIYSSKGIPRTSQIYKGTDLITLSYKLGIDILSEVAIKLIEAVDFIDVYYTHLMDSDDDASRGIGVYWQENLKRMDPNDFLNLIKGPYPAIACYAYLQIQETEIKGTRYFIDDCPGMKPSTALSGVLTHPHTTFFTKGDQTNHIISTADIVCRYIDEVTKKKNVWLGPRIIDSAELPKHKTNAHFIGPKWFNQIKPSRNQSLRIGHKYAHPRFFLFVDYSGPFKQKDNNENRLALEKSLLYKKILNKAAEKNGMVKFFEPKDIEDITTEDFLVVHDENSKNIVKSLKEMECPASIISPDKISEI
ncbi:MAG: hypothetical protein ABIC95_04635 [archaeon]